MNRKEMLPNVQADSLPEEFISETIGSLKELNALGKCTTDEDVEQRIEQFFQICEERQIRPGIETLALALDVTRATIYNWSVGVGCSRQRQQTIQRAKSFISSFLEQALYRGRLNPASGIFLLKNWCGYKDTYSLEDSTEVRRNPEITMTPQEIMERHRGAELPEMPDLD